MKTYEEILESALSRVPSKFDKREGSVIYDALAPACYELARLYEDIELKEKNTFAGTADREHLIKRGQEIGISPNPATYAVRKAAFTPIDLEINLGERFSYENINFYVSDKIEAGFYEVTCEQVGSVGNHGEGDLIPINYVRGLTSAKLLGDILIYGEDEEATEDFRARYFATLPTMTLDGNIKQYQKWCKEYPGIGNYKIFPEWAGKNTVKVSILSAENTVASQTLVDDFQEYLDPNKEGLGNGKAPIGAVVTVSTATVKTVNVTATVVFKPGYYTPVDLEENLVNYLRSLNYNKGIVSYAAVSALFYNDAGIDLVLDLKLNGAQENITLAEEEIAALGTLTVEG